jgi:hypothetical protein
VTPRRSLVCLVALVVAASVAATAHGLYAVAVTSGVPKQVAVLYPLITDGLALVAYWATKQLDSARYPWLVIVVAAGLSGLAQAVNLAGLGESPTWLRFGVGYWPAVAVLFAAHLLWLVGRPRAGSKEETDGAVQLRRRGQGDQHPLQGSAGGVSGRGGQAEREEHRPVQAGDGTPGREGQVPVPVAAMSAGGLGSPVPGPPVHDPLFLAAQAVASHLEDRLTRRALIAGLRDRGHQVSTARASELLKQLRDAA